MILPPFNLFCGVRICFQICFQICFCSQICSRCKSGGKSGSKNFPSGSPTISLISRLVLGLFQFPRGWKTQCLEGGHPPPLGENLQPPSQGKLPPPLRNGLDTLLPFLSLAKIFVMTPCKILLMTMKNSAFRFSNKIPSKCVLATTGLQVYEQTRPG